MKTLTDEEAKIVSNLLHLAADEFSNHGCNDYSLPDTAAHLRVVDEAYDGDPPRSARGLIYVQDDVLMRHFARKLA